MREYDRFEKGAANSNTSTRVLKQQLEDPDARIIITTIQKLATLHRRRTRATRSTTGTSCSSSTSATARQFGDMHTAITKAFKRYHLFGFTGTPIFAENAGTGGNPQLRTTEQAFGDRLHTYTIVDAINDKNVLPFRIDYVNTIKLPARTSPTSRCSAIDTERALLAPERIGQVVGYIAGALRPEDQAQLSTTRSASKRRRAASTRCSPPPRSTPPSATTPSSPSSSRSCRRTAG